MKQLVIATIIMAHPKLGHALSGWTTINKDRPKGAGELALKSDHLTWAMSLCGFKVLSISYDYPDTAELVKKLQVDKPPNLDECDFTTCSYWEEDRANKCSGRGIQWDKDFCKNPNWGSKTEENL